MNDLPMFQSAFIAKSRSRSMGLKLFIVCALALAMTIPALFVDNLVDERTQRANDVVKEISSHVGGQQTFLGPSLAIPYTIPAQSSVDPAKHGIYIVFPAQASATVKTTTEERRRSLFKVPVFHADLNFSASFDLTGVPYGAPQNALLDWSHAEFIVGVTDARGALSDGILTVGDKASTLAPATIAEDLNLGADLTHSLKLTLFGTQAAGIQPNTQFTATASMRFSGAQRIALLAYGKTTHLAMQGDWANPSFDGGFLPVSRSVSPAGFVADWTVPFIARGVRAEGDRTSISGLDATALGVSFIELADGFDFGFLIAGVATVALLSINAGWIFASRIQAVRAGIVFTLLYTLIYLLLRLEDNALLVGAVASFIAVAAAMYFTRTIDWYGSLPEPVAPNQ
jgi:inner membrane protein